MSARLTKEQLLARKRTLEWRIENLRQMAQSAHSEGGMCKIELQDVSKQLFGIKERAKRNKRAAP